MSDKRVFLGGEGKNELGGWAAERPYRTAEPGVIEALLKKAAPDGWSTCGARQWKSVRGYQTGRYWHRDVRIIRGLALDASESGADVLAFARDLDEDPKREAAVREGIAHACADHPSLAVVGGVAKPCIEGWVLAAKQGRDTEGLRKARCFEQLGEYTTASRVADVEASKLPEKTGARSLDAWIDAAREALSPS